MALEGGGVALVSGITGITGSYVAQVLAEEGGWTIYGTARRPKPVCDGVQLIAADLTDAEAVQRALHSAGATNVTHVFHCAYTTVGDDFEDARLNRAMLKALVEGAEAAGARLQHVYNQAGTKWYGMHLQAQLKTPAREDDARHLPPNFYYDQIDYLQERVDAGAAWTFSSLRPNPVCGVSQGSFMNLTTSIGVYGAICAELGLPLRFPGSDTAYHAVLECVDARLLAQAAVWCATAPAAANQSFNINNGDVFRWAHVWPKIAKWFGLELAPPLQLSLTTQMKDKGVVWERIVKKHGLRDDVAFDALATWPFADFIFAQPCDWFASTNKLKRAGFDKMHIDTDEMFLRQLQQMADMKLIPQPRRAA